jgi:hypothetical protein
MDTPIPADAVLTLQTMAEASMTQVGILLADTPTDNQEGGDVPGSTAGTTFPCRVRFNTDRMQEALIDGQIVGRPTYWLTHPEDQPLPGASRVQIDDLIYNVSTTSRLATNAKVRKTLLWRQQAT